MMMGIALQSFHAPQMLRIRAPGVELALPAAWHDVLANLLAKVFLSQPLSQ